jgi:hypothetical protein
MDTCLLDRFSNDWNHRIIRAQKNDEKVEDYAAFPNLNPVQMAVYCLDNDVRFLEWDDPHIALNYDMSLHLAKFSPNDMDVELQALLLVPLMNERELHRQYQKLTEMAAKGYVVFTVDLSDRSIAGFDEGKANSICAVLFSLFCKQCQSLYPHLQSFVVGDKNHPALGGGVQARAEVQPSAVPGSPPPRAGHSSQGVRPSVSGSGAPFMFLFCHLLLMIFVCVFSSNFQCLISRDVVVGMQRRPEDPGFCRLFFIHLLVLLVPCSRLPIHSCPS